jgi:cytochrome c551/c552
MKNSKLMLTIVIVCAGFSLSISAKELSGQDLVITNRCYGCHHETQTLIGPPYIAIAARHHINKDVMVNVLAEKILLGGGGNWGVVPMVPNEHVSRDDALAIARWILNLQNAISPNQ